MSGMMTKVWGPGCWIFLHCLVTGYPEKINMKNRKHRSRRKHTIQFLKHLPYVLPCKYCRESFIKFSKKMPIEKYVNSNRDLCFWLYTMHNKVNKKLGIKDTPTFKQVCNKYTSYKASCDKVKKGCIKGKNNVSQRCRIIIESNVNPDVKSSVKPDLESDLEDLETVEEFDDKTKADICDLCDKIVEKEDRELLKKMHKLLKKVNRVEWLIFGKESCPYCVKAKEFAEQNQLNYEYIDMNTMNEGDINNLYQFVTVEPITIPIIFRLVDDKYKYIGGFSEIKQFKKNKF